jgi:tetratricopeptide (TPR) repeat protein
MPQPPEVHTEVIVPGSPSAPPAGTRRNDDQAAPASARQFGRYLILEPLGDPVSGTLFAAFDTVLGRRIALRRFGTADDVNLVEVTAIAKILHPSLPQVYDVGRIEGQSYVAMELCQGVPFGDWCRAEPRSFREVAAKLLGIAGALKEAHAQNIAHGNVDDRHVVVVGARAVLLGFGSRAIAGKSAASDVRGFAEILAELMRGEADPQTERRPVGSAKIRRLVAETLAGAPPIDPGARIAAFATALGQAATALRVRAAWALGLALALVIAGAFVVVARRQANLERLCTAGASVIDAAFGPDRRQQIEARYAAAGVEASWSAAAPRFADWVARWRKLNSDTCHEAHATRTLSARLFDRRMACLDDHRARFANLTDSIARASLAQLVSLAGAALPPVAECAISSALAPIPEPDDEGRRTLIGAVRAKLREADLALVLGENAKGRRLTAEAVAEARSIGYAPLLARALIQLGRVELLWVKLEGPAAEAAAEAAAAGVPVGPTRAFALLQEAASVAEQSADDEGRAAAAIELAAALRDAARLQDADRWLKLADAAIVRIGDPATLRATLDLTDGWLKLDRNQSAAAAVAFQHSLRLRRESFGPRAPELLASMSGLCQANENLHARAACYRETVAFAKTVVGPRHVGLAYQNTNLASVLLRDERTRAEACPLLRESLAILEAELDRNRPETVRTLAILAQCLKETDKTNEVRGLYREALKRATFASGPRADLHLAYGTFLMTIGELGPAIPELRAAVADATAVYGPIQDVTVGSRYNLADTYRRLGRFSEALRETEDAIVVCEKYGAQIPDYADLYELKGQCLAKMGRKADAYDALKASLALHERLHTEPTAWFFVLHSLGNLERELKLLDLSEKHLEKAMEIYPMEVDPARHGEAAVQLAMTVAERGRAAWPRACEIGMRGFAGMTAIAGLEAERDVTEVRTWLRAHHCTSGAPRK